MNLTHISLAVAFLSLGAAFFQGYVNSRNLDVVQRDIGRREHLRACKEVIEAYFDAKLRIERVAGQADEERRFEARQAVAHFAALGTYLANFQDDAARARYTELSRELERLAAERAEPSADPASFVRADEVFAAMNADCVRSTRFEG